jgi:hypothetical protein
VAYKTTSNCYDGRELVGKCEANIQEARGGCRHLTAENMSRAEFGRLPVVRCNNCRHPLGRVCPDCQRYY